MSHNSTLLKLCLAQVALAKLSLWLLFSYVIIIKLNSVLIYFLVMFMFYSLSSGTGGAEEGELWVKTENLPPRRNRY